ncbi:hypothetical protein C5167_002690 [Papaver somniferum]|uniref:Uncharacterized protein n=1 Tax=Papaver somniferum TaxID=3469 RepID=A0A4Y7KYS5_PAPSO|nr:hypothetical protein C5167_002690 [Papaver somniferum]
MGQFNNDDNAIQDISSGNEGSNSKTCED